MTDHNDISRRKFLSSSAQVIAGVSITAGLGGLSFQAQAAPADFLTAGGKIGYGTILPLSGGFTVVSQPWIHAIKYAIDEQNAAGGVTIGGTSYEVENPIGDEQYSAQGGLTAFRRQVADNVHYSGGYVSVEARGDLRGLSLAVVSFDCTIKDRAMVGSHDVIFCEIHGIAGDAEGPGLAYFARKFHELENGA